MSDILKKAIRYDIYASSIVSSVTIVEGYLESIMRKIYKQYPGKLSVSTNKNKKEQDEEKYVPLNTLLNAKTLEEVFNEIIDKKILKLMYANPNDYFQFIKDTFELKLDDDLVKNFIEIKASRDLIVHTGGKVNNYYLQKSGSKCRVNNTKQNIPLDIEYILNSIACMKKLVRDIYKETSRILLKKTKSTDLFP